jgi:aryl-alcohol dehydrogenase-like predicted oxidoreductase
MIQRVLGQSDLLVSRIGLGTATWGITTDEGEAALQIKEFAESGGNLVDTADIYGDGRSEHVLGRVLDRVVPRSNVILTTKAAALPGGPPLRTDASRGHLLPALEASLRRMRTDYVDLWQLQFWDPATPLDETLSAIDTAIATGRARYAGICNYTGWQAAKAATRQVSRWSAPLISMGAQYSLLERGIEREIIPAAADSGLGVLPSAPLGHGPLTGTRHAGVPAERACNQLFTWYADRFLGEERTARIVEATTAAAASIGATPLAVALAWVRDRPSVVAPIVGARTAEELRESLDAEGLDLPEEIRRQLDEVSAPHPGCCEAGTWAGSHGTRPAARRSLATGARGA